mgnify:FL=1|jgi:hypothetical protein
MAYKLNKTDGSLLVELVDGRLDISSADIALIGKNYQGFGESINENFIKMLENFSNSTAPVKPLKGQLWYDTATGRLKIYDGTTFRSTDSTIYASSQPSELIAGDIWIDGSKDQLLFWNGTEAILVGPGYTKNQLRSGDFVETIRDTTSQNRVIVKKYLNGSLYAIVSKETTAFTPFPAITGFDTLKQGYNISSVFSDFEWLGQASSAGKIVDELGNVFDQNSFLSAVVDDVTTGRLAIANDNGLSVGLDTDLTIKVSGQTTLWQNNIQDADLKIDLKDVSGQYTAMYFDADTKKIGVFKTNPAYTLDVTGDLRVTGDLLIEGNAASLDIATLRVEDHQIELAIKDDSTLATDAEADDGGIVIRVEGDDKRWTWLNATNSWTSSHSINIENELNNYAINDTSVLSLDTLGSTVVNSSLTGIGQLNTLVVGNNLQSDTMTLTEDRITTTSNLEFASTGSINLINKVKITNVETPVSPRRKADNALLTEGADQDVVVKRYVDDELASSTIVMGVDVTGLGTTYAVGTYGDTFADDGLLTNIAVLLTEIYPIPAAPFDTQGKTAKIHAYYYTATSDPIDVNSGIVKSLTAVDSAGTQNVNVIGDFTITSPTASVNLTANRIIITMKINSGIWDVNGSTIAASAL